MVADVLEGPLSHRLARLPWANTSADLSHRLEANTIRNDVYLAVHRGAVLELA